jgi:phosphotransferase system  glucose/maltose/N-acetylglucosamine-specific IIC component
MQMLPALGACSLGVVIGWLVRYFIRRFATFDAQVLRTLISILVGALVIRFLDGDKTAWWFYPVGLLIGFIVYSVIAYMLGGKEAAGALYGLPVKSAPPTSAPDNRPTDKPAS